MSRTSYVLAIARVDELLMKLYDICVNFIS